MKNLLMVTYYSGYKHEYLPVATKAITELGERSGQFKVTSTTECSLLNQEDLKNFDALLFGTTGDLSISDKDRDDLMAAIYNGKPFIGIHNATDTYHNYAEYTRMIGGTFVGHPWSQEIQVKVEDQTHPSTRHLPKTFKVKEEVYTFKNWSRDKTHVLISLDNSSVDLSKGNREDHDYAMCWCHNYGKARVFYTAFGHYDELWSQEWFRTHVLNGILWAMKLKE